MKYFLTLIFLFIILVPCSAQELYTKAYGKQTDDPIIFLHGGPGSNSLSFELTTAQLLADQGFFVVVYDRRGEGRSMNLNATFNFKQTFDDLISVYEKYGISKAHLVAFSFGGLVGTSFTINYPQKVKSLILTSSLVSMQDTYQTILDTCSRLYAQQGDSVNLDVISQIENMDRKSLEYRDLCSKYAFQNGLFSTPELSDSAKVLYAQLESDSTYQKYSLLRSDKPGFGFWKNEHYTTMDTYGILGEIKMKGIDVFAIYGKDDGLFSKEQINNIEKIVGVNNIRYLDRCSHYLFIDQQAQFLDAINSWLH